MFSLLIAEEVRNCNHPTGMTRRIHDRHSDAILGWLCLRCQYRHFYPEYA